eukprot:scaffold57259_cov18-Prasinocladus_malaysianus.AAC.1
MIQTPKVRLALTGSRMKEKTDFMWQQQNAIRGVKVLMLCGVHMNTRKDENVVWGIGCYHIINGT